MKYKLIAMDMDGTLLTSNKEITPRVKEVLAKAAAKGVISTVCTGRLFASANYFAKLLGTQVNVIASNGAYIRDKKTGRVIYDNKLGIESIIDITNVIKEYGFCANYYTTKHVISEQPTGATSNYSKWNSVMPEDKRIIVDVGKSFDEIIKCYGNDIIKAVVMSEKPGQLDDLQRAIENKSNVTIVSSWNNNIEIMAHGVSKGNSVRILAECYGIAKDEVICFGDNQNDASMIEYAGLGIAMGNATDELKQISDYITDTNDNDGVAKAIEKFVLEV